MSSADQVPVKNPHSTMRWHKWVVLIAGSTGSALRAVRPPNRHITPVARRDLVTPQARQVACNARPCGVNEIAPTWRDVTRWEGERHRNATWQDNRSNPLVPSHCRMRVFDRDLDPRRFLGQRSCEPLRFKGRTHGCTDQACLREESSCQLGAVHTWHLADVDGLPINVRFRGKADITIRWRSVRE